MSLSPEFAQKITLPVTEASVRGISKSQLRVRLALLNAYHLPQYQVEMELIKKELKRRTSGEDEL
jgi:hypothetical protein